MTAAILAAFARAKAEGRTALIPYVMAGYPDPETSEAIAVALGEAGADLLELGIPFSDPQADGPTIQAASQKALEAGVTPATALELAGRIAARVETPLLLMTYYNPIFSYGLAHFCEAAADAGVAGLIVPDLPPEEADVLGTAVEPYGLALVYLVAPTSTEERIERIARAAEANGRGFLYCVALSGVTGARSPARAPGGVPHPCARPHPPAAGGRLRRLAARARRRDWSLRRRRRRRQRAAQRRGCRAADWPCAGGGGFSARAA